MKESGIIGNSGQAAKAAAERERRLQEQNKELLQLAFNLGQALSSYRKQHDAGFHNSHCCCVNCVFSTSLLDKLTSIWESKPK